MRSTTEPSSAEIDGGPLAELVARYVEAVALFDRELYRSVWTDDAVWVVDGRGSFVGPDAITELYVELRGRQELAVQRVMSGRATADGDTGSGRWIIHSITRTDGVKTFCSGHISDAEGITVEAEGVFITPRWLRD